MILLKWNRISVGLVWELLPACNQNRNLSIYLSEKKIYFTGTQFKKAILMYGLSDGVTHGQ